MSRSHLLRMTEDEVHSHLSDELRVHVSTLNADGTIHLIPLRYVLIDGMVTVSTDPSSQKIKNLRRDPRVTCMVETGVDFHEMRGVQLVGKADIVEDESFSLHVLEVLLGRYDGLRSDEARHVATSLVESRVPVRIRPERIVSWDHRKLQGLQYVEAGATR